MPLALALVLWTGLALAEPGREELIAAGEKALARGDAPQASLLFQRAGLLKHTADAEIGLTRSYMQAGEYRRALAFAAHTAGAHADIPAGRALYAQLLELGGQAELAARFAPGPAARFAPASPDSASLPPDARVVSSGVLMDHGRALASVPPGETRLWVRNGLGAVVSARIVRHEENLAILELAQPLAASALEAAPRDAFPGSPAYAVGFASTDPAWPLLRAGFLGRRNLGIALPPGPRGGPVLDSAGRLIGIAVMDADGRDQLLPVSRLNLQPVSHGEARRRSVDEIYELALRASIQVIAAP